MAKGRGPLSTTVNIVVWLTGVIVSLAVGYAMATGDLALPVWLGGVVVAQLAGWVVVVLTIVSVVLAIIEKLK